MADLEQIRTTLKSYKPESKDSTLKQYASQLRKLFGILGGTTKLNQPKFVLDKISDLKYLTRRNYINSLILYLQATEGASQKVLKTYMDERNRLNDEYNKQQSTGKISEKQADNFVSLAELQKMTKRMIDDYKKTRRLKTLMDYTMFEILMKHPFRNDLAGMKYIGKREYNTLKKKSSLLDGNYLVLEGNNMFFVLRDYKTAKKYGEKKIPVDKSVKAKLRKYIREGKIEKGEILFDIPKESYSHHLIEASLKYSGKRIGTTMIRHIYLSDKHGETKKAMDKDAYQMGHSLGTATGIYIKDPKDFKEIE